MNKENNAINGEWVDYRVEIADLILDIGWRGIYNSMIENDFDEEITISKKWVFINGELVK